MLGLGFLSPFPPSLSLLLQSAPTASLGLSSPTVSLDLGALIQLASSIVAFVDLGLFRGTICELDCVDLEVAEIMEA